MIASERQIYILKRLHDCGVINLKDIAKDLNIAEITVRRDFEKLEKAGKLKRVQGGAVLDSAELTMNAKKNVQSREKDIVAKYAADIVEDGNCIFIDAGTSMAPLIKYLLQKKIMIVTYNELVVKDIKQTDAQITMLGGRFVPSYDMFVGPIAQESLKQFHFDYGFFGCTAVSLQDQTAYVTDMDSLLMKQIALKNSSSSILLIDSNKLEKKVFLEFEKLDRFNKIFCNKTDTEYSNADHITFV